MSQLALQFVATACMSRFVYPQEEARLTSVQLYSNQLEQRDPFASINPSTSVQVRSTLGIKQLMMWW
jgi:hypothetical protein